LIAPVLLLREGADPPTTAGLTLRWRTLLNDGAACRTTVGVRALLTVSLRMNPLFAALPDWFEAGRFLGMERCRLIGSCLGRFTF
jgi:hypothetical protein